MKFLTTIVLSLLCYMAHSAPVDSTKENNNPLSALDVLNPFANKDTDKNSNNNKDTKDKGPFDNNPLSALDVLNPFANKDTDKNSNNNKDTKDKGPFDALGNAIGGLTGQNQSGGSGGNSGNTGNPLDSLFGNIIPSVLGNNNSNNGKMQLYIGGNAGLLIPLDETILKGILNMFKLAGTGNNILGNIVGGNKQS